MLDTCSTIHWDLMLKKWQGRGSPLPWCFLWVGLCHKVMSSAGSAHLDALVSRRSGDFFVFSKKNIKCCLSVVRRRTTPLNFFEWSTMRPSGIVLLLILFAHQQHQVTTTCKLIKKDVRTSPSRDTRSSKQFTFLLWFRGNRKKSLWLLMFTSRWKDETRYWCMTHKREWHDSVCILVCLTVRSHAYVRARRISRYCEPRPWH
jgi:hypothetical protein